MKVLCAITNVLLSLALCQAQNSNAPRQAAEEAYTRQLVSLLTGLQKNPWLGWESGTEVVVRYLVDRNAEGTPLGHIQPDLVYKVMVPDERFIRTYVFKGKPGRQDFLVKDQTGLDVAWAVVIDPTTIEPTTIDMEMDGFTLTCLLSELTVHEFPGGTRVTKQWALASQPSIVLRKELIGSSGWKVTSTRVIKRIGEKEFQCVEIKKWLSIYSNGQSDVITTQYLSPNVPGHVVEQIEEYFKVKKKQKSSAPYLMVHQKVVELKL